MIEKYDLSYLNLNSIKNTLLRVQASNHGLVSEGVSSYNYGMPILEYSQLFGLKQVIKKYIQIFTEKHQYSNVKLINSWFNISEPGSKLKAHKHEESIISGAFYISGSTPLIFPDTSIKPYPGLLVIFSSDLIHYTEEETEERIIISFNTDYL